MNAKVLKVLLLLGSNSEDAVKVLAEARGALAERANVLRRGSLWRTAAWGFEGPDFVNQVLELEWIGEPESLLAQCLEVEKDLGRIRDSVGPRYASRRIDIDLLLTSPFRSISGSELELPHPRLHLRRFVLQPLAEHWSDWRASISGATVGQLLGQCSDENAVYLLKF
jgi:2-amino-4-hydroxy-6-hydroxymethyldihydropteridine diphosphokinase